MSNRIKIKRNANSNYDATTLPSGLHYGELALQNNSSQLFIGRITADDQAIAAKYLLDTKKVKKILILDLDVHQGNGTAFIFKKNPYVFTCSIHGSKNYPFKKEISDLDISIEDQCRDSVYLNIVEELLPKLYDEVRPDFVFYLSGVDILETDKLGRLGITLNGCKKRDELIMSFCYQKGIPLQCSMGGGYSEEIKTIIEAHANTYRVAKEIFT